MYDLYVEYKVMNPNQRAAGLALSQDDGTAVSRSMRHDFGLIFPVNPNLFAQSTKENKDATDGKVHITISEMLPMVGFRRNMNSPSLGPANLDTGPSSEYPRIRTKDLDVGLVMRAPAKGRGLLRAPEAITIPPALASGPDEADVLARSIASKNAMGISRLER